jgi:hypothetical protein
MHGPDATSARQGQMTAGQQIPVGDRVRVSQIRAQSNFASSQPQQNSVATFEKIATVIAKNIHQDYRISHGKVDKENPTNQQQPSQLQPWLLEVEAASS